jgi:integrase/recombinase XerD
MAVNVALWQERFAEHLALTGRTPATVRSYLYNLRRFLGFLTDIGRSEVHEIQREDVQAYQIQLHRHRKPDGSPLALTSQNREMAGILVFCGFLHSQRYLLVNPAKDITLMRVPRRLLPTIPDEPEVLRLLTAPDAATPLGLRDRAILELLYSSALRNTELRRLQVGDVELARLQVRVHHGKGRKSRVVPLGEPAAAWVADYLRDGRVMLLKGSDPGTLFVSHHGKPMGPDALVDLVKKNAEKAGLAYRFTPHLLRHCCATHMLRRKAGLRHLQELLGHSSPESTQVYTKVELSDLREVHQRCHPRESF